MVPPFMAHFRFCSVTSARFTSRPTTWLLSRAPTASAIWSTVMSAYSLPRVRTAPSSVPPKSVQTAEDGTVPTRRSVGSTAPKGAMYSVAGPMITFAAFTATGHSFQGWMVWAGDSWQWHPLQFEVRDVFGEVAGVAGPAFGLAEEVGGVDAGVAVLGGEAGQEPADV